MKTFKNDTIITIALIIIYVLINSLCIEYFSHTSLITLLINVMFSTIILLLIYKNDLFSYYGFKKIQNAKKYLYFLPLLIIISVNIWNGIVVSNSLSEIIIFISVMFTIGFLEEIIFRGFLYKMMEKDSKTLAVIVSSLTFGIGHIVNIFIGSPLIDTLFQILYATAIGYLFVIIFQKSKSIWPCILTHSLMNALSIFSVTNQNNLLISSLFLTLVAISYAEYIRRFIK